MTDNILEYIAHIVYYIIYYDAYIRYFERAQLVFALLLTTVDLDL